MNVYKFIIYDLVCYVYCSKDLYDWLVLKSTCCLCALLLLAKVG